MTEPRENTSGSPARCPDLERALASHCRRGGPRDLASVRDGRYRHRTKELLAPEPLLTTLSINLKDLAHVELIAT